VANTSVGTITQPGATGTFQRAIKYGVAAHFATMRIQPTIKPTITLRGNRGGDEATGGVSMVPFYAAAVRPAGPSLAFAAHSLSPTAKRKCKL
jgi:hypothetical protein